MFDRLQPFDDSLFRLINSQWTNPAFDFFFKYITDFGVFEIPLIIAGIVAFIFAKPRMKYAIILLILSVLMADMIGQDLKLIFERLRPYRALDGVRFPAGGGSSKSFSFPSNHAINMFAAMTVLAWELRKKLWLSILCFVPAFLVAYSRVYVGVHYPTDVIGGALIGFSCSALILGIDRFLPFVSYEATTRKVTWNWTGLSILLLIFASVYRYSVIARNVLPLSAEECQYWDWSRQLDLSYYSKPPAIAYIIRFFTEIFGTSGFSVRAGAVTLSLGIGIISFFFTRELFRDQRTTFFTLLAMNLIPLFSLGAIIFTTDTPMMFFWAACCHATYLAIARERNIHWYIAGICFGLGLLSKYAMIYFLPCLAVFFVVSPQHRFWLRRPAPYLFLLIGALMFTPVIVWSMQHDWINFRHVATQAKVEEGMMLKPGEVFSYIGGQMAALTPLIFLAMIYFTVRTVRSGEFKSDVRIRYLLAMGAPVFCMLLVKSIQGEVLANWAAPAYYTWVIFAVWQFGLHVQQSVDRAQRVRRISFASAALALPLIAFILFHDRTVFRSFQRGTTTLANSMGIVLNPAKLDPGYSFIGYDQLGEEISGMMKKPVVVLRPGRTFLLTQRYQIAASLAFYVKGHPHVHTVNFGDKRMTQYDIWRPSWKDYEGWDAIYVTQGNGDKLEKEVAGSFREVKRLLPITFEERGIPYKEFTIYVCRGFSGDFPMAVESITKF
ncbi:glycosyltransferase family 39 protein [Candidatus Sumerlaeota bacterium]|nr:glycosyltransferase family 39 protein [Candidatus Sumerlaeota bacterium]